MAARVAQQLEGETELEVETVKGGLGEFSVSVDGRKSIDTSRLWYPAPGRIVERVRTLLAEK